MQNTRAERIGSEGEPIIRKVRVKRETFISKDNVPTGAHFSEEVAPVVDDTPTPVGGRTPTY